MINYTIQLPGMTAPVIGKYNGTKEEAKAHCEKIKQDWERRRHDMNRQAVKFKQDLSGPNVLRGL